MPDDDQDGACDGDLGGLHVLTRYLALELAQYNIQVNAVAPAVVATPIYERFVPEDKLE